LCRHVRTLSPSLASFTIGTVLLEGPHPSMLCALTRRHTGNGASCDSGKDTSMSQVMGLFPAARGTASGIGASALCQRLHEAVDPSTSACHSTRTLSIAAPLHSGMRSTSRTIACLSPSSSTESHSSFARGGIISLGRSGSVTITSLLGLY
jgi:hypothetical protein